ncbi:hypothetical protein HUU42_05500 [bacterium]|nr:hypothetical protein [bacterium]
MEPKGLLALLAIVQILGLGNDPINEKHKFFQQKEIINSDRSLKTVQHLEIQAGWNKASLQQEEGINGQVDEIMINVDDIHIGGMAVVSLLVLAHMGNFSSVIIFENLFDVLDWVIFYIANQRK